MHFITEEIVRRLTPLTDERKAVGAKAYMKNQFEFFGIQTPERRSICKKLMKEVNVISYEELGDVVKELWQLPQRELQYFAIELMAFHKKVWEEEIIKLFEYCILNKSWWDTVDFIATECVSPYFRIFPLHLKGKTNEWNKSEHLWLQRSSLLAQKGYKRDTNTVILSAYILHLANSKEFFIQKAIGWMLREYARVNPEWVKEFVGNNKLAPLSKREALKHL
jgi:3-methyladenine DNA glycosylase AlkD